MAGVSSLLDPRVREQLEATRELGLKRDDATSPEKLAAYRERFLMLFGPAILQQLDGEALLRRMHSRGGYDSLVYWLEFKHDDEFPTRSFGRMGGGSSAKFGFYQRAEDGQWVAGAGKHQRVLSLPEAVAWARRQRDQLVACGQRIGQVPPGADDAAYLALQRDLDRLGPDVVDVAWGHKYLSLLFPDTIDNYHVRSYQDWNLLCSLQRPPTADGRFVCAGRFVAIAAALGWSLYDTTAAMNECNGPPNTHFLVDLSHVGPVGLEGLLGRSVIGYPDMGLGDLGDLPDNAKPELRARVARAFPGVDQRTLNRRVNDLEWFLQVESGAFVVAAEGREILAVGKLTGDYTCVADELAHQRAVTWLTVAPFTLPVPENQGAVFDAVAHPDNVIAIRTALLEPKSPPAVSAPKPRPVAPPPPPGPTPPPATPTARRRAIPPLPGIRGRIQAILDRKGQAILYGPPGTGKTYWAERTACDLAAWEEHGKLFDELDPAEREAIRGPAGRVRLCTFHPAYGYEDFIEGYRPEPKASGMSFERRDGVFKRLCTDASAAAPADRLTHYLIIDEVNRGDVPRIFGELLTLLELDKRGRPVVLPSGSPFTVPANIRVIGTMNTADRSIALLDAALRRRFGFVELMPDKQALGSAVIKPGLPLGAWLERLNHRILLRVKRDARNLQIGHAYFLDRGRPIESTARFVQVLREDVLPLLEEYCYADFRALAELVGDRIVDAEGQRIRDELFTPDRAGEIVEILLGLDPELSAGVEIDGEDEERSNEELMRRLLTQRKSEAEITEVFRQRYADRGKSDPTWVAERVATYRRIAERSLANDVPPSVPGLGSPTSVGTTATVSTGVEPTRPGAGAPLVGPGPSSSSRRDDHLVDGGQA